MIDESNRINHDITQKIASVIKTKGVNVTASLFTGHFVSDGIFKKIFEGDAGETKKLELSKHSDYIILGKETVNFTENPELQNMVTARGTIEIHIISAQTGTIVDSFTVSEVGAGFSRATAEELVKERILKKLAEKKWVIIRKGEV